MQLALLTNELTICGFEIFHHRKEYSVFLTTATFPFSQSRILESDSFLRCDKKTPWP
jgi:hypothetical protein